MSSLPAAERIKFTGSATAPVVFFDSAPSFGHHQGVFQCTLSSGRYVPGSGVEAELEQVIVCHLRCDFQAAIALKNAIESALLLASQTESKSAN